MPLWVSSGLRAFQPFVDVNAQIDLLQSKLLLNSPKLKMKHAIS